ncbi:MAG TPA: AI-2E family transporter [Candidatus Angelobacter sp.]|nr:AI-2E family transporter [Candidatus Angelobacter sp.]
MEWFDHLRTTGSAIKNWFVAQCLDAAAVAVLWLIGLLVIGVPLAPLWALLAGVLQFVPHFGPPIAVIFPAMAGFFWTRNHLGFLYVLILFAVIMVLDGLLLQPYLMKRTAKVPFWASLLTPIAIVLLIPAWWAVLLAPPILAVIFAFRRRYGQESVVKGH